MNVIKMSERAWSEVKVEPIKKPWTRQVSGARLKPTQHDDEEDENQVADFRGIIAKLPVPQLNNIDVADWLACDAALGGQEEMTDEQMKRSRRLSPTKKRKRKSHANPQDPMPRKSSRVQTS